MIKLGFPQWGPRYFIFTLCLALVILLDVNALAQTELSTGVPFSDSLSVPDDVRYYQIYVSAGENLFVFLDKNEWYCSLYIKYGTLPTTSDYDDLDSTSTYDQAVAISGTQAGYYYIMVRSQLGEFGPYTITAHNNGTLPALTTGQALTDDLIEGDDVRYYQIYVSAGENLFVFLDKNQWYCSLYIKYGTLPTTSDYDDLDSTSTYDQAVAISGTQAGYYYIMVRSQLGEFGPYTITAHNNSTPQPNNPPDKPLLSSPANGATDVLLTPTLQTGSFSDPDSGDVHLQTEWQVSTVSDFSSTILNTTSVLKLTSLTVPQLVLVEGVTHYWRVRFYDNHALASEWSDVYSFATLTTSNDQNENGIPDSQENDTVDLDNDETPDIKQDDIKSLNTVVGEGQMGVCRRADPTVTAIESIESIDPETISSLARPYSMPLGLFAMRLTVANPGDTAQVTVHLSEAAPSGAKWYMYDSIDGWADYSDHATFAADRKSVVLELKDGEYGDADDIANGTIVDPGGFALASWIEGLIYDSSTDQGIARAQVTISDLALSTGLEGHYMSMILPGTYTLEVCAAGYDPATHEAVVVPEGDICTEDVGLRSTPGDMVTSDLWIRAVINTEEKGPIDAVWQKGGEDTTTAGDRVIWGHFYAGPADVTWGSANNPDLFAKIWFDHSGRLDVNFFHVSVPDIEVYSDYPYDGTPDEHGTTTMERRYIRQYYDGGQSYSDESYEDGVAAEGYSQSGNPSGYGMINNLRIGSMINTEEKGPIDAVWRLGGQDTTARGDQVVWGHFYASPSDVTWGSEHNPDLFVKIWFDYTGRVDVNFFHVSVPDIEVYSDLPSDATYDQQGTTIMADRYIRHEYWRK